MIGCDIVKIERFNKLIDNKNFLNKYFTMDEQNYINSKTSKVQTMAGIYSAKEAVLKALHKGIGSGINLLDVQICHQEGGAPYALVNNETLPVSISHDGEYAFAVCLVNGKIC